MSLSTRRYLRILNLKAQRTLNRIMKDSIKLSKEEVEIHSDIPWWVSQGPVEPEELAVWQRDLLLGNSEHRNSALPPLQYHVSSQS